jgi:hypothetical protein
MDSQLFDEKTAHYLKWSTEQDRWANEIAEELLKTLNTLCEKVEVAIKKGNEVVAIFEAEGNNQMRQEYLRTVGDRTREAVGFTDEMERMLRDSRVGVYLSVGILPDFMIQRDATGQLDWHNDLEKKLLYCEIAMGVDTFEFFKTGYQRFCNEVRRKAVDIAKTKFISERDKWSMNPIVNVKMIRSSEIGGIGFHCDVEIVFETPVAERCVPRARLRRRVEPRGNRNDFEQVIGDFGGGGDQHVLYPFDDDAQL